MLRVVSKYITFMLIAIVLLIGAYFYWRHEQRYPNTHDAYIKAHVITVAPQINGDVQQIFVHNLQDVKKNQLLFTINAQPFKIAYKKAKANLQNTEEDIIASQNAVKVAAAQLAQRQAQLIDIQKKYARIILLVKEGYFAKAGGDDVKRALTVAKQAVEASKDQLKEAQAKRGKTGNHNAQLELANTAIAQAKLNLQYTNVYAAADGQLAQFTLQPGQTVTAYQPLFSLVENHTWWAMANMKETDLNHIRVGQKAIISVDMYSSHPFIGIVKSISPGSGTSFDLLPAENATGNWVKVTQRFPVRIEIQNPTAHFPLRIGASCSVTIDTHSHA